MKGDFSKWDFDPKRNFNGVLQQQGKVLLDSDWNEHERITNHWQDQAGRDVIGTKVAAVPASMPDSFKVQSALVPLDMTSPVELMITPGHLWADGLLVYLKGEAPDLSAPVRRIAPYLQPPIQDPPFDVSTLAAGVRDAVILEVWREAVNGFQIPELLIEPALGGPDTTERIHTAMAFKLFRMAEGDTCENIRSRLQDDFSQKGKLAVSLEPPTTTPGDCPVVEGGGYTGFEHHLYRIEIAQVASGATMFKWSQFNGGLVGRGKFDASDPAHKKVQITANMVAINTSGLTEFYLEAVEYDEDLGHWRVTYGAHATLASDNEIDLTSDSFGTIPPSLVGGKDNHVFFRLWNDIRRIADFPQVTAPTEPNELQDGIRLEFEPAAGANYVAGDFWTFSVRAGEIPNEEILVGRRSGGAIVGEPPAGVHYHRVPLAVLNWDANQITFDEGKIKDCRDVFPPLTGQHGCCTYSVGDGVHSVGDFDSIELALRHLPADGGKVCVLPGEHFANVTPGLRASWRNIQISGCGDRSIVRPHADRVAEPIFRLAAAQNIQIDHMRLMALRGTAIELQDPAEAQQASSDIRIFHNDIVASVHAINIRVKNELAGDNDIWIAYNRIAMLDRDEGRAAIFTLADDVLIERNKIVVVPAPNPDDPNDPREPDDPSGGVLDPCAEPQFFYTASFPVYAYLYSTFAYVVAVFNPPRIVYLAQGGIQIAGGSERVRIIENEIIGGRGNGVTLGSDLESAGGGTDQQGFPVTITNRINSGEVSDNGNLLSGIGLRFERADGTSEVTITTDATGHFSSVILPAVDHRFFVTTPGYEINSVATVDTVEFGLYHTIHVNRIVREVFAFIYDVTIDRNMISNMGLAGIGVVEFFDLDNTRTMVTVEDLTITRNCIAHCVQQLPAEITTPMLAQIGFGGIALADCENAMIRENRIENNGVSHIEPVCGIFILSGDKIEVSDNHILNNGPKVPNPNAEIRPGHRGGIVVLWATRSRLTKNVRDRIRPDLDGVPAVKVHDNVVVQPLGHALLLFAIGPVSVVNNQLTSQGVDFRNNRFALLAGTVLIFDLGLATELIGKGRVYSARSYTYTSAATYQPSGIYSSDSNNFNLTNVTGRYGQFTAGGHVMFNDNQVTLDLQEEEIHFSISSILLLSLDDVSFCGNQSACYFLADIVLTNAYILAPTVRTGDNRLQEDFIFSFFSLLSIGIMNACTSNQGTHCIVALGNAAYLVNAGNRVLLTALCERFAPQITSKYGG